MLASDFQKNFTINSHKRYKTDILGLYYKATTKEGGAPMVRKKPCVLACVTSQFECDRIIKTAEHIANEEECELRVLSVLQPTSDYSEIGGEIEYLYKVARESGADMTVLFHDNAPYACADFVNKNNVQRIVTGMHDGGNESFLVMFNRFAPMVSITMVAKDNTAYSMDVCKAAVR